MKTIQLGMVLLSLLLVPTTGAIAGLRGGARVEVETASSDSEVRADNDAVGAQSTGVAAESLRFGKRVAHRLWNRVTGQKQEPATPAEQGAEGSTGSTLFRIVIQLIFALIYYQVIVANYPMLDKPVLNAEAEAMQNLDAVAACCHPSMTFPNAALAVACTGPRAAHTFHSVGVMNYWLGCCLMTCFPCCTLIYTNACTDLNERLGGQRQNIFTACLCSFCCPTCLVAQDAQTLDMATGTKTGFCYTV